MRILRLTLTRQWFDLVASGAKTVEYREFKPYWIRRLMEGVEFRQFDAVHFTNGYGAHRPFVRVEFVNTTIREGAFCQPVNGERLQDRQAYFLIYLGPIREIGNVYD